VARAGEVIDRYGPAKAIVLARFIPIVRTVMNPMAGVLAVPPRIFVPAQVAGGLGWTIGVILAGYWLGSRIPGIDTYLLPIIAVIVLLSLIPVALEIRRVRRGAAGRTRTDGAV
jgi:membrane-associated protein